MAQAAPSDQVLPTKEAALFRQIVKLYEGKAHKKAVKTADQVLKKFPNHGETLAMKGLALRSLDKKEEAFDFARRGLKADLKSHVCWHVLGLLYRADRNYREAIKCYLQALRLDKDNGQILRDLALLQIQTRDMAGFLDTRYQLLQARATNRTNWLGYAVAHALSGNLELATTVLAAYEGTGGASGEEGQEAAEAFEASELALYRAQLLQEGRRPAEALQLLDKSQDRILDRIGLLQARAELLADLGKQSEAEDAFRKLLALNPEDGKTHRGLLACLGLLPADGAAASTEQRQAAAKLYRGLVQRHPHSSVCQRALLDFLEGDELTEQVEQYVRPYLLKGIPSLFSALKPLYRDAAKAAQLGALFSSYRTTLEASGSLPPLPGAAATAPAAQGPGVLVWVLAYLGQHHSELHDTAAALEALDAAAALEGPPPAELHTFRSKVLRRAGDLQGAAEAAEAGRKMDLADRYLNSLAVRALFEAGRVKEAEATAALFTRDTERQGAGLRDMQHMWYEVHCARAHMGHGEWGRALLMLREVGRHFGDIREDELDFHAYCLRKQTLRAYSALLRMQDSLYAHPAYTRAARLAIECWLVLHDRTPAADSSSTANGSSKADASAKEVEQQRQRLESAKLSGSSSRGGSNSNSSGAGGKKGGNKKGASGPAKEEEADAAAAELLATADPLAEAATLVGMLTQHASGDAATHVAAFEVALRRGRLLKALSAAQRALALGEPDCPAAHRCVVRLALAVAGKPAAHEVVQRVIDEGVAGLLGGKAVRQYSDAYVERCGRRSLAHAAAAVEMQVAVDPACKAAAAKLLSEVAPQPSKQGLRDAVAVHRMLVERLQLPQAASAFKAACTQVFKWAAYFEGPHTTPAPAPKQKAGGPQ